MTAFTRIALSAIVALGINLPVYADDGLQQLAAADTQLTQDAKQANSYGETKQEQVKSTVTDTTKTTIESPMAKAMQPVNINTADAKTIASNLQGIGHKKAEAIVEYRTKNGAFKSLDELANVQGFTKAWLEKNRDKITLG